MIKTSNRAVLYARFSSDNQRSESIDAQIRAMQAYCKHNNIMIVDTYIDEAKSATTAQRPAFQRMMADSKLGTFNIVLVHKLDRFARNRYDSAVCKRELKKSGISVHSVLENLNDSPESIMLESVLEGMNEYYSQNLAREVMKGLKETALQCKHTGGTPPLGYDVEPVTRKLTVNEKEAEAVRLIFSMYAEGKGYSEILSVLHEKGYKTKQGKDFAKNSLYSILTNPKYQGIYVFNKSSAKSITGTRNTHLLKDNEEIISIEGGCPRIVDQETFAKVQKRIDANKHAGGRLNAKHSYLLSGKVFCKHCGRAMVGNARNSGRSKLLYITYRCPSQKHSCSNKEINRNYLERYVIELLEGHIFNVAAMKKIAKKIEQERDNGTDIREEQVKAINEKLTETENAIANITAAIATGMKFESLLGKLAELEEEKARLEVSLIRLSSQGDVEEDNKEILIDPKHIPTEYMKVKDEPYTLAYKEFIQSFIDCITVGRYRVDITIKTGLDIFPHLDTTITVRRQEIYETQRAC